MKGTYLLFLKFDAEKNVKVGKLGCVTIKPGWYVYVGSGMNSLIKRVARHFKKDKTPRWHIDYITPLAKEKVVFLIPNVKVECEVAKSLAKEFECVRGFGSSDCSCRSHLFYVSI